MWKKIKKFLFRTTHSTTYITVEKVVEVQQSWVHVEAKLPEPSWTLLVVRTAHGTVRLAYYLSGDCQGGYNGFYQVDGCTRMRYFKVAYWIPVVDFKEDS